jgi:hypothetical protein
MILMRNQRSKVVFDSVGTWVWFEKASFYNSGQPSEVTLLFSALGESETD